MTCDYNTVQSKLLAPALRAVHINQLLNVKSLNLRTLWSHGVSCTVAQFNQGKKTICLRITEHIACGNTTLMQSGTLELEILQAREDLTLGWLSGLAPWLWRGGLSSVTRHTKVVAGDKAKNRDRSGLLEHGCVCKDLKVKSNVQWSWGTEQVVWK